VQIKPETANSPIRLANIFEVGNFNYWPHMREKKKEGFSNPLVGRHNGTKFWSNSRVSNKVDHI
jgi:hypothetical protein